MRRLALVLMVAGLIEVPMCAEAWLDTMAPIEKAVYYDDADGLRLATHHTLASVRCA